MVGVTTPGRRGTRPERQRRGAMVIDGSRARDARVRATACAVTDGSMCAGQGEHLCPLALREPTPDAVRFVHPQRVFPAGRQGRTLETDRLGLRLAAGPRRTSFALGMEEERAGHATTCRVQLPVPEVRVRSGKAPGVRHVDPLFSNARRWCPRSVQQAPDEQNWTVPCLHRPTAPGIGARSTWHRSRTPHHPCRVGRRACVALPLGRIRADRGAVDLPTLDLCGVRDKTLITFFVDLELGVSIVVVGGSVSVSRDDVCELRHLGCSRRPRRRFCRTVTARLRCVHDRSEVGPVGPNGPAGSAATSGGSRSDRASEVLARPKETSLHQSSERGQVPFTASAGGVS